MTATTVTRTIEQGLKNRVFSKAEVKKLEEAIGKTASNVEARKVAELDQLITGPRIAMVLPDGQEWPRFGKGAQPKMNALYAKFGLPIGENEEPIRARMEAALARIRMVPLDQKPRVSHLLPLYIPNPPGMMDGPSRTAYFDVAKQHFFLNVADPWRPDGIDQWFGPISIKGVEPLPVEPEEPAAIEPETLDRASRAYFQFSTVAMFDWDACPTSMPPGARTVEAEFMAERRINGYRYSAVFAVGALAPGAELQDPNLLDEVFIKRSGPDGARYLGPLDMTQVDGGTTAATLKKLRAALASFDYQDGSNWRATPPLIAPGASVTNVAVKKEPGFDTYSYGAMLVGDPNAPQSVVFTRSGGQLGTTFYSDPVAI